MPPAGRRSHRRRLIFAALLALALLSGIAVASWRASSTAPPAEQTKKQARLLSPPGVAGLIGEAMFYALLLALALLGG